MRSKKDAEPRLQTERDWTAYHKTGAGRQTDRQDRQDRQRDREREKCLELLKVQLSLYASFRCSEKADTSKQSQKWNCGVPNQSLSETQWGLYRLLGSLQSDLALAGSTTKLPTDRKHV